MLENGQMTDFAKTFDQLYVKLSLGLNVIETTRFFQQKELKRGGNKIELGMKRGPSGI